MHKFNMLKRKNQGESRRAFLRMAATTIALVAGRKVLIDENHAFAEQRRRTGPTYNRTTDPYGLNQRLRGIISGITSATTNPEQRVQSLYAALRVGGSAGVRVSPMDGRPPRTATMALSRGGDCTDLLVLFVAGFREMGISYGAEVMRPSSGPDHIVPTVQLGGSIVRLDPQSRAPNFRNSFRRVGPTQMTLTGNQVEYMYHEEWGKYLMQRGRWAESIAAYEEALTHYEPVAEIHGNLAVLYSRPGATRDAAAARRHITRAIALDPAEFSEDVLRARFAREHSQGVAALRRRDAAAARRHLQAALDSGYQIDAQTSRSIEAAIASCDQSLAQERAEQASRDGRSADALEHLRECRMAADRRESLGGTVDPGWRQQLDSNIRRLEAEVGTGQ